MKPPLFYEQVLPQQPPENEDDNREYKRARSPGSASSSPSRDLSRKSIQTVTNQMRRNYLAIRPSTAVSVNPKFSSSKLIRVGDLVNNPSLTLNTLYKTRDQQRKCAKQHH